MPAAFPLNQLEVQPASAVLLPPLAVQTCHAPGEGLHEPSVLWPHLRGLHRLPEAADPLAVRLLLTGNAVPTDVSGSTGELALPIHLGEKFCGIRDRGMSEHTSVRIVTLTHRILEPY